MADAIIVADHAIVYTDAGFDLKTDGSGNITGWGFHGYTYTQDPPKKGSGNPKAVPTDNGYLHEAAPGEKVTVVNYVDNLGGSKTCSNSNDAELLAFEKALEWLVTQESLKSVKLFTDSRMVSVGTMKHLHTWPETNWITRNGKPVPCRARWEKVKVLWDQLKEKLELIEVSWLDRDGGYIGNENAHRLATRGKVLAHHDDPDDVFTLKEAQGYWAVKNGCPRILQAPRWYFSTVDTRYKREDGSVVYYVGQHGTKDKEDDLPGKKLADNFFGAIIRKEPDPVLEKLRQKAIDKDTKHHGKILIGYLDSIFAAKMYKEIDDFGTRFLYDRKGNHDVTDSLDLNLLVELNPVGLGFRMINQHQALTRALDAVIKKDPYYKLTEITDLLYEVTEGKKVTRKLRPEITQITKYLDFEVEFNLEKESAPPKPFKDTVRLLLGNDILSRNQLAAISDDVVSVHVVCWRESELVGRYATLVELSNGDIGLWARTEANIYYDRRNIS